MGGLRIAACAAPFAVLLACIALLPLLSKTRHWWEKNRNKALLSSALAAAGIYLYVSTTGDWHRVGHAYLEYLAFLALLGSLFIISGGIHISGAFSGFPYFNTLFLGMGAILANLLGTTGASMLLIRPLLRANKHRRLKSHIVIFFIFIVGNCGGLLTPMGDPPLYLGFLAGVPFNWNWGLLKGWAFVNFALLFIFQLVDEHYFVREDLATRLDLVAQVAKAKKKIHVQGWRNVLLLLAVMSCVILSSWFGTWQSLVFQIVSLGCLAIWSWLQTPPAIHKENQFSLHPMGEVASLFFGIFGAMLPVLSILEARGASFALREPAHYFWATGALSGFLDNAPTYLTFASMAAVKAGIAASDLGALAANAPMYLAAVSYGAVFMGAMTYVGNGPNFMIKTIAERSKVQMPGFGGYLLWSLAVMLPLMLIFSWVFF